MTIKHFFASIFVIASFIVAPVIAFAATGDATYDTPGTYTYTVPAGVDELYVKVWGAGGGGGLTRLDCTSGFLGLDRKCIQRGGVGGAGGGYAEARIDVTAGETFTVFVGNGGQGTRPVPTDDYAADDTFANYSASPDYTSSSAEASIVTSQLSGKYIGAGGGATGFSLFNLAFQTIPPRTHNSGSLSGKGVGQVVGATGAGIAGQTTSWCAENGYYKSGCIFPPAGGNGFGTYPGITSLQGSSPRMPQPVPLAPDYLMAGGAGANGGAGGSEGLAGNAPGGGAGPSTESLRGGAGKVTIQPVGNVASGNFDFDLKNSGDTVIVAGGVSANLITGTITQGTARPTSLSVTSITNQAGASVFNTTNGITVSNTPFNVSSIVPTQSSVLYLEATPTTPPGVYTVTVSADTPIQTSSNETTYPSGTIHYCLGVRAQLSGKASETFACDRVATFNPANVPGNDTFVDWDNVSYGSRFHVPYYDTNVYKDWLTSLRKLFADHSCGIGKWTLYPYGYSPYLRTTGYICTGTATTVALSSEPAVHKTTTFTITVDTYNLVAEKGADVCSATDAYTRLTWTRNPSATMYRLYKQQGSGTGIYVNVAQPTSGTTVTYYDPDNNFSNSTGLTVGDLYSYIVAANVGGTLLGSSTKSSAFPSTILPSGSCAMTYTVGGGDVTIQQGTSLSVSVPFALTSGATQSVSAQFTPAVTGITFAPALPGCSSIPCTATTVISVANSVPVGTYTYTISARTSGNITATNTLIVRVTGNSKPYSVKSLSIIGPCSGDGVVNKSSMVSYVESSPLDPDGDTVTYEYQIDYGSGYGASISNGTANYLTLTWTTEGAKKVRVRAVDSKGAVSPWTEQGITVRATCVSDSVLTASCASGFNTVTNEATWYASAKGGKAPYTYSWNNAAYGDSISSKAYINTANTTVNGPVLMVKDASNSKAIAFPTCSPVTRPNNTTLDYRIDDASITLNIGQTASTTISVISNNGISKPVTITSGQVINQSSGSPVGYITYSPNTDFTCTTIIPDCTREIGITVNPTTGRVGTFKIQFSGTTSTGEVATGEITVTVVQKPIVWTGINLTLSNGTPTCNQTSIIARWNADPNPAVSGYNIYRSQGSGQKILMNINGPIAQQPSGFITYTDTRVAANEAYTYEVREIVSGNESTPTPYSIRTAPAPTLANCPGGFGFSVTGDDFIVLPGQSIKATARVRLLLGTSLPVNLSANQVISLISSAPSNSTVATQEKKSFVEKISSAVSSFFGIAHAAGSTPYVSVAFAGSSSCASIPCDVPLNITVSPSAAQNEYLIPLVAQTSDKSSIAFGYIQVIVSVAPVVKPATVSVVSLSDGMADCTNSSLMVTWTKDLNASGYYLYRSQPNQSFPVRVNAVPFNQPSGASRTHFDENLIPSITYTYYVTSIIGGVESKPSASVTRVTPNVPMGVGSCPFTMNVTGDGVSIYPGQEKITKVRIFNSGSQTAATIKIGTVSISKDVAQSGSKSEIARFLSELFALGPIKLNAEGTVTATFVTNGKCASLPCTIDVKITSAANALAGTYTFPLTASTDGPIASVGGVVTADGSLPVQLLKALTPGCPPNCNPPPPPPGFSLGISATPATVTAGQSTSSLVSLFTITPTGVDKSSIVLLEAAKDLNGSKNTNITTTPASFNCNHSVPTCVQNVTISTTKSTAAGSYHIPVTARTSSGETARVDIALTVIDELIAADTPPLTEARVFYPSGAADSVTGWKRDFTYMPRRSAYLAPVTVDIETRKILQSSSDYTSCYSTVENGTTGWSQGSKNSPVSPSLVFTKKTVTIAGTEKFSIYCKKAPVDNFEDIPTLWVKIDPINEPVIREF